MSLTQFSAYALTRSEMKNVVGGGTCAVCSHSSSGNRTCGTANLEKSDAKSQAKQNNASSAGTGYTYTWCCSSC